MGRFNTGDWVEITDTPDEQWIHWHQTNNDFCGAIGQIVQVEETASVYEDDDIVWIAVDFQFDKFRPGTGQTWYKARFLKKHIVAKTTKLDATTRANLRTAGRKLQEWESVKRKAVDKGLKGVFGREPRAPAKVELPVNDEEDPWEVATSPGFRVFELDDIDDDDLVPF